MPSVIWKIKLHPAEDDSFYRRMGAAVFSHLKFHPKQTSLEDAVSDADVVTTLYSTSGLEAMIMDRPLIVATDSPRGQELAWWPSMGGGTYAHSAEDFSLQVRNLMGNDIYRAQHLARQRDFLAKSFANQGSSAKYIATLLEQYVARWPGSNIRIDPYEVRTQERLQAIS